MTIVCDEEGRLDDKPYNCRVLGYPFYGTIVIVGVDGEEFADVPISYDMWKSLIDSGR